MYIRIVKANSSECKHTKIQSEQDETVSAFRARVAQLCGVDHFKLLFQGRLLADENQTLASYKVSPASTLHVIQTPGVPTTEDQAAAAKKPPPTDDEIQQFMIAFGLAIRNPSFHKVAQRLGQRESLENITATCPELAKVNWRATASEF
jgi:hypothetical protein